MPILSGAVRQTARITSSLLRQSGNWQQSNLIFTGRTNGAYHKTNSGYGNRNLVMVDSKSNGGMTDTSMPRIEYSDGCSHWSRRCIIWIFRHRETPPFMPVPAQIASTSNQAARHRRAVESTPFSLPSLACAVYRTIHICVYAVPQNKSACHSASIPLLHLFPFEYQNHVVAAQQTPRRLLT